MLKSLFAAAVSAAVLFAALTPMPAIAATDPPAATTKKPPTPGQIAFRERQKKCSAEWKEAKAKGTTGGLKWPQFWSACNKRLKTAKP
jgi:hypothetical protein